MDVSVEQLGVLAERLRAARYKVGPGQHLDACAVVAHLHRHSGTRGDVTALAGYLAPIYCSSAEQQRTFEGHLRTVLGSTAADQPKAESRRLAVQNRTMLAVFRSVWPMLAVVLSMVTAAVFAWYWLTPHNVAVHVTAAGQPASDVLIALSSDGSERLTNDGRAMMRVNRFALRAQQPVTITARKKGFHDQSREIDSLPIPLLEVDLQQVSAQQPPPQAPGFERIFTSTPKPEVVPSWVPTTRRIWSRERLAALAFPGLSAMCWALYWTARRRAWLSRLPSHTPRKVRDLGADARHSLSLALGAGGAAHELRRRRWQSSAELNVEASLQSSLEGAGQPSLVFGSRVEPDYLVLIDETSQLDHLARLADELMVSLQKRDVSLKRYFFRDAPLHFDGPAAERHPRKLNLPTVSLESLLGAHPTHRLILVSDGRPLFDMGTGRPLPCVEQLLQRHDPVVLTPTRKRSWGRREWALSRLGFVVLPLDSDGLAMLGELHGSDKPVETPPNAASGIAPPHWVREPGSMLLPMPPAGLTAEALCDELQRHLGDDAFLWLQGCAVYPEIHWGMTLRIGASLLPDDRRLAHALTPLVRLPWLRESYMGEWLREALRSRMSVADWGLVHTVVQTILEAGSDSGDLPLRIGIGAKRQRRSEDPSPPNGVKRIRRDAVFLRFMQGPPKLAVAAADSIRKLFFKDGLWLLGLRGVPLALIAAVATAGVAAIWWPRIDVSSLASGPPVSRPAIAALAISDDAAEAAVAVGYDNGEIWQTNGNAVRRYIGAGPAVTRIVATRPGRVVARLNTAATIDVAIEADGSVGAARSLLTPATDDHVVLGRNSDERAFLSSDGRRLLINRDGVESRFESGMEGMPACMAFTARGSFVAVSGSTLRHFDPQSGRADEQPLLMSAGCAARPGSDAIFIWDRGAGAAPIVWRYDLKSRQRGAPLVLDEGDAIAEVTASVDGAWLWVRRGDQVSAYAVDDGQTLGNVPVVAKHIATTADASRVAVVTFSDSIELWERRSRAPEPTATQRLFVQIGAAVGADAALSTVLGERYGYRTVIASPSTGFRDALTSATQGMGSGVDMVLVVTQAAARSNAADLDEALRSLPFKRVLVIAERSVLDTLPPRTAATKNRSALTRLRLTGPTAMVVQRELSNALAAAKGPLKASDIAASAAIQVEPMTGAGHTGGDYLFVPMNTGAKGTESAGKGKSSLPDVTTDTILAGPLLGHTGDVWSVAFSPDGGRIVSGSTDNTVRLWDARTGTAIGGPLLGHSGVVARVAFSPDGTRVMSVSGDAWRVWDARTGAAMGRWENRSESGFGLVFSPDGTRIASGGVDGTVRVWDAKTGAALQVLSGDFGCKAVWSVAFSPDGRRIVSSCEGTLQMWDVRAGAAIGQPLRGHSGEVTSVAFSPDGTRIVSGSEDGTLRLWDAKTGSAVGEPLRGHSGSSSLGVRSVAFSPDGTRIVSGGGDGTVRLWSARTGAAAIGEPLRGHSKIVLSVAFSPDGTRIVSGSSDKTLRLWDARPSVGARSIEVVNAKAGRADKK